MGEILDDQAMLGPLWGAKSVNGVAQALIQISSIIPT